MNSLNKGNPRVLVIEDDSLYQVLLQELVEDFFPGAEVAVFAGVEDAWQWIAKSKLDGKPTHLILADQYLPDGYGIDLWKTCLTRDLSTDFILVSGMAQEEFAYTCNVHDVPAPPAYLRKSSSYRNFRDAFASLVGREAA